MKKLVGIFLTVILVLSNCTSVFAASDTTPPTIVDMKWSGTEFNVGNVLEVEIEAYDYESGISTVCFDTFIYRKRIDRYL